jgi:hypothetical protein
MTDKHAHIAANRMLQELVGADDATRLTEQQRLADLIAGLLAQLDATEAYQMKLETEAKAA